MKELIGLVFIYLSGGELHLVKMKKIGTNSYMQKRKISRQ